MKDTLILLKGEDVIALEQETFALQNAIANFQKSADFEIRIEYISQIQKVLDICSKYERRRRVDLSSNGKEACTYIANFLYRIANSREWEAPSVMKRAKELFLYAVS